MNNSNHDDLQRAALRCLAPLLLLAGAGCVQTVHMDGQYTPIVETYVGEIGGKHERIPDQVEMALLQARQDFFTRTSGSAITHGDRMARLKNWHEKDEKETLVAVAQHNTKLVFTRQLQAEKICGLIREWAQKRGVSSETERTISVRLIDVGFQATPDTITFSYAVELSDGAGWVQRFNLRESGTHRPIPLPRGGTISAGGESIALLKANTAAAERMLMDSKIAQVLKAPPP